MNICTSDSGIKPSVSSALVSWLHRTTPVTPVRHPHADDLLLQAVAAHPLLVLLPFDAIASVDAIASAGRNLTAAEARHLVEVAGILAHGEVLASREEGRP